MVNICVEFGKNVKKFRMQKQLTQEALSDISGLSRNYISDVELGKRSISLKNIEVLALSLDVKIGVNYLFLNNWPIVASSLPLKLPQYRLTKIDISIDLLHVVQIL